MVRDWFNAIRTAIILGKEGGGGGQAHLNAPTISLSGSVITIVNPASNGNFCDGFDIYCNGVKVANTSLNTIDLESIGGMPTGTDTFTVRCTGTGMLDSIDSNSVTYAVLNYFYTSDNEPFYDSDGKQFISA